MKTSLQTTLAAILLLLVCACSHQNNKAVLPDSPAYSDKVFYSNFAQFGEGEITFPILKGKYPSLKWAQPYDRVHMQQEDKRWTLAVDYPRGSVGPSQGGAQFVWSLTPKSEYTLQYSLKFEEGFDFRLGGKLPGLTSGGEKWTGGNRPLNGEGWSARLMWREHGGAELYLYFLDMKGKWGDSILLGDLKFVPGVWYDIKQRIKVNTPTENDAQIQVWVNAKLLLDMQNFRLRKDDKAQIDSVYFSTFHGGNQPQWGPLNDSKAYFGDFTVSE